MNIYPESHIKDLLLNLINYKLTCVISLTYVDMNESQDMQPQELLLVFESGKKLRISCSSDGESIACDEQDLKEVNLGEYGKLILMDISSTYFWKNKIGNKLLNISLVLSSGYYFGLLFNFDKNNSIVLINLGDELFIYENLPESLVQEESIIYRPLN
ncbi:hypothetical protein BROC_02170 [Candidatus Brocadiaceae bacterium]|nr:hypothetical protein BROC_02170 [Candidatus Brocadiaceae bacterium]